MSEIKYIKVGDAGKLIPVEDCYSYIYDCGDGRTVLRIKIADTNITVPEIMELFNNQANNQIYEYKITSLPEYSVPADDPAAESIPTEPVYELVSIHEDYCKDMSYEYSSNTFSIEIIKKLTEEKLSDEVQQANNEIMVAVTDMYAL